MIRDINSMTREELILALEKMTNLKNEAGKKIASLEEKVSSQKAQIEEMKLELQEKTELIKLYNLLKYSKHRRSLTDDEKEDITLFSVMMVDEPEGIKIVDEQVIEVPSHKRSKSKKESHIDYSNLPHKEIVHLPEEDVLCDVCHNKMNIYKYETKEELVYVPAQVYVEVHKIPYYECKNCTDKDGGTLHSHVDTWKPLIAKSKASSSLMAALIDYKFNMGLPYYTVEKRFQEDGVIIPRANMTNWMLGIMKYIEPLYKIMHRDLLNKEIICADETTMYVLQEEGKPSTSTSYLWQYQTCSDDEIISLFEYQPTRSGDVPKKTLEGFKGIILSDKYAGYSKVEGATRAYCHGHSYRYIRESYEILPKGARSQSLEAKAVKKYKKIFDTDRKIYEKAKKLYPDDQKSYYQYVQEHRTETLKVFEDFLVWLKSIRGELYTKPKFLRAVNYILNDEEGFKVFMKDPRIELTNNGAERNFRKWCVNRTRCKFYVSTRGADGAAKLYSLMMTAKNNGYNVYAYFDYLFDNIRYEDISDQESLKKYLPYKKQLPEYCKMQTTKEIKERIKALEDTNK